MTQSCTWGFLVFFMFNLLISHSPSLPTSNEEGEEHLRQRKLQLPFSFATGEAVLYETGPSLDMPDMPNQGKGGKLRKPPAMAPSSLLSSMLKQDMSVYQPNNDPNSQFSLDKAFRDSHALLNVPGNTWQPSGGTGTAGSTTGIKEEATVQDMMDSLQQIIGDSSLCGAVEELQVDQEELKEWENALLRMNSMNNEAESPIELNDILANDIFSYVEGMLFTETNPGPSERLPECLSELQLQEEFEGQGLGGFFGVEEGVERVSPGRGLMKLTHIEPEVPPAQQDAFMDSLPLPEVAGQNMPNCNNLMGFNTSLAGQQNQPRLVQQNDLVQVYPDNVAPSSLQNQAQPLGFHNHLSQPIRQINQWVPNNETQNMSLPQGACLQGQFTFNTQNMADQANQRLPTWPSPHPSVQQGLNRMPNIPNIPNIVNVPNVPNVPNGHHHVLCGQPKELQQDSVTRLMQPNFGTSSLSKPAANTVYGQQGELLQPSSALYAQQGELMQTSANTVYNQQGALMQPSSNAVYGQQGKLLGSSGPAPTSSCMFGAVSQAPVNGLRYDPIQEAMISSCQKTKALLNQSSPQGSCFYQSGLGDNVLNSMSSVPPEDSINAIACHLLLGTESMIPQQQFVNCNGQTQVRAANVFTYNF